LKGQLNDKLEQQALAISQALAKADNEHEILFKTQLEKMEKREDEREKKYKLEIEKLEEASKQRASILYSGSMARSAFEKRLNNINRPISIIGPLSSEPAASIIPSIQQKPTGTMKKSSTRQIICY
jgi:hypothetical protein